MQINTMAYGADSFEFRRRALIKVKSPFDFTYETSCSGFEINGTEPEGTSRRIIFLINNQLYKFGNSGLIEYKNRGEIEDILENGNTVGELLSLNDVPEFVGKKIFPIIALDAPADSPVYPKIKIAVKVNSFNDIYTKYDYSPVYNLPAKAKIHEIREDKFTNGNGTALVQCQLDGAGDWLYLADATNKKASSIQFRTHFIMSALDGSDFAKVNSIRSFYSTDSQKLSGSTQEIISLPQDYPVELRTFYALIKHSELVDAEIKAFVSLSPVNAIRENVMIGTTTGDTQTLYLSFNGVVDNNILQDTLHIEVAGRTFSDFYFDTEDSTVTLKAPAGQEIYASYNCGSAEDWREMAFDETTFNNGVYSSRFTYRATDFANKKVVAVKFVVERYAGNIEQTEIGTGNGKLQIYALPHRATKETLKCSGAWKYDELAQILKVVAANNSPVTVEYDWQGTFPEVFGYIWGASV